MFTLLRVCKTAEGNVARRLSYEARLPKPWFVDERPATRVQPPHLASPESLTQELPPDVPEHIVALHDVLRTSPHLELGGLQVRPPPSSLPGPPLVEAARPKGRRRRGGTDSGRGVPDASSGPWRWVVLAQVRVHIVVQLLCSFPTFIERVLTPRNGSR